jgi:protein-S-isoprenylcysteine O-methyltransferase Ste14
MLTELVITHFLGIYFLMIGLLYGFKSVGHAHRTGFSHIHYGQRGSATWWNRQCFNLFRGAIVLVCFMRIAYPIDPYLGIFQSLYQPWLMSFGVLLMLCAFGMTSYLQGFVGDAWRSGIDQQSSPNLFVHAIYGRTRNPCFIAIMTGQLGFFLALPSVFSLVCLCVGVITLYRQALAEETALTETFGQVYTDYRNRVPRWL